MAEAEHIYHSINTELHNDLPALFESRINMLASNFTSFFQVESKFQEESFKVSLYLKLSWRMPRNLMLTLLARASAVILSI